jgi:iron complex outermembrane receptor protein
VEVETQFLATDTTRLGLQAQYLDSKYDRFSYLTIAPLPANTSCRQTPTAGQFQVDCSGRPTLRSGEWTGLASIEQMLNLANGGQLVGAADARYESAFDGDASYIPQTRTYSTTRLDLSFAYLAPNNRFSIKAYVDNVTNKVTIASVTLSNTYAVSGIVATPLQPPRTYGVRAQVNF